MGWEERNGRLYYYEKRREGQRVVSQYVGTGTFAEACAVLNEAEKQKRQRQREAVRQEQEALDRDERQVENTVDLIRTITHAALVASGYHTHKGQWRKRREQGKS